MPEAQLKQCALTPPSLSGLVLLIIKLFEGKCDFIVYWRIPLTVFEWQLASFYQIFKVSGTSMLDPTIQDINPEILNEKESSENAKELNDKNEKAFHETQTYKNLQNALPAKIKI